MLLAGIRAAIAANVGYGLGTAATAGPAAVRSGSRPSAPRASAWLWNSFR